jgi:hypothetical protein
MYRRREHTQKEQGSDSDENVGMYRTSFRWKATALANPFTSCQAAACTTLANIIIILSYLFSFYSY